MMQEDLKICLSEFEVEGVTGSSCCWKFDEMWKHFTRCFVINNATVSDINQTLCACHWKCQQWAFNLHCAIRRLTGLPSKQSSFPVPPASSFPSAHLTWGQHYKNLFLWNHRAAFLPESKLSILHIFPKTSTGMCIVDFLLYLRTMRWENVVSPQRTWMHRDDEYIVTQIFQPRYRGKCKIMPKCFNK